MAAVCGAEGEEESYRHWPMDTYDIKKKKQLLAFRFKTATAVVTVFIHEMSYQLVDTLRL